MFIIICWAILFLTACVHIPKSSIMPVEGLWVTIENETPLAPQLLLNMDQAGRYLTGYWSNDTNCESISCMKGKIHGTVLDETLYLNLIDGKRIKSLQLLGGAFDPCSIALGCIPRQLSQYNKNFKILLVKK